MGFYLSKPESLEFAVLPSNEVSGPIGLGEFGPTDHSHFVRYTIIHNKESTALSKGFAKVDCVAS